MGFDIKIEITTGTVDLLAEVRSPARDEPVFPCSSSGPGTAIKIAVKKGREDDDM